MAADACWVRCLSFRRFRSRHLYRLWRYHDRLKRFNIHVPELAGAAATVTDASTAGAGAGAEALGTAHDAAGFDAFGAGGGQVGLSSAGLATPSRGGAAASGAAGGYGFPPTPGFGGPGGLDFGLSPPHASGSLLASAADFDLNQVTAAALAGLSESPDRYGAGRLPQLGASSSPFRPEAMAAGDMGLTEDHAMVLASIAQSPPRPSRMPYNSNATM